MPTMPGVPQGGAPNDPESKMCPRCKCCKSAWDLCTECAGVGWFGHSEGEEDVTGFMCRACSGQGGWNACEGACDRNGKHERPVKR